MHVQTLIRHADTGDACTWPQQAKCQHKLSTECWSSSICSLLALCALWLCLLTLHGFGLQVVKAPSSPAEDAMLVVQKGFMRVSVSMNEIQKRKPNWHGTFCKQVTWRIAMLAHAHFCSADTSNIYSHTHVGGQSLKPNRSTMLSWIEARILPMQQILQSTVVPCIKWQQLRLPGTRQPCDKHDHGLIADFKKTQDKIRSAFIHRYGQEVSLYNFSHGFIHAAKWMLSTATGRLSTSLLSWKNNHQ